MANPASSRLAAAPLGGLPQRTWSEIVTVLQRYPELRWVKLYGSRALGRQRPGSDIDLAFSCNRDCSAALAGALEELPTPYRFDVSHWESLQHPGLRQHIASAGITLHWPAAADLNPASPAADPAPTPPSPG
jgi:predicted nucleotidyltransferase